MNIFILDGLKFTSVENCHKYLADVFHFPKWYGNNLDALADLLSEYNRNTTIIVFNTEAIYQQLGEYGYQIISVIKDISKKEYSFNLLIND